LALAQCPATWYRLHEFGCDAAQGYSNARPMPADPLDSWLGGPP